MAGSERRDLLDRLAQTAARCRLAERQAGTLRGALMEIAAASPGSSAARYAAWALAEAAHDLAEGAR